MDECCCEDITLSKENVCAECGGSWRSAVPYHERVARCPQHKDRVAICSPGKPRCPTCIRQERVQTLANLFHRHFEQLSNGAEDIEKFNQDLGELKAHPEVQEAVIVQISRMLKSSSNTDLEDLGRILAQLSGIEEEPAAATSSAPLSFPFPCGP